MIKILHFYPADNQLVSQYVDMLRTSMQNDAEVWAEHSLQAFTKTLKQQHPDIIHLHGCWRTQNLMAFQRAQKEGARLVFSPHGQLEPWILRQHFWRDKLPKLIAYQRRIASHAYAIITMGRMEKGCMTRLKYNPRIETVYNAVITETITKEQMGQQVYAIYRKVLDSDPWPRMDEKIHTAVKAFIKAGLTGDAHWLTDSEQEAVQNIDSEDWRKILLYAHLEHIDKTVAQGIHTTGQAPPSDFDPAQTDHYMPHRFDDAIRQLDTSGKNDTERFVKAIRSARKLTHNRHFTIMHLVELADLMRHSLADEEKTVRQLDDHKLVTFAGRIMQLLSQFTGLEEGFMPLPPRIDQQAHRIEQQITKHLEII